VTDRERCKVCNRPVAADDKVWIAFPTKEEVLAGAGRVVIENHDEPGTCPLEDGRDCRAAVEAASGNVPHRRSRPRRRRDRPPRRGADGGTP